MSTFDESLHPRGQAGNAGQFKAKVNTAPTGTLDAPQRPAPYAVQWKGESDVMIAADTNPWLQGADGVPVDFGAMGVSQIARDAFGDDCECEDGAMSGVLVGMDSPEGIQRCDACVRFDGDLDAAAALARELGRRDGADLQVWFTPAPDSKSGHVRRRSDGRMEVADRGDSDAAYGCGADDDCILANGHDGDCNEDREVWAGPDELYPVQRTPEDALTDYLTPRPEDYETARSSASSEDAVERQARTIAKLRAAERMFVDGCAHPGDELFESIWTTGEGGFGEERVRREIAELSMLRGRLADGAITPRSIIGTGYRGDTRKLANDYLDSQQVIYERALEVRGRNLSLNASNVNYRLRETAQDKGGVPQS